MKIQQFLKKKSQRKLAFSLVELAIVMLIIGILAAAVSSGGEYIRDTRLANARALTNSSPVHSTKGLAVWYDAVSEASFAESEADDGADIATWFDINSQSTKVDATVTASATTNPTYVADSINNLPAVKFSSSADAMEFDNTSLTSRSHTLFVVAKRNPNLGQYAAPVLGSDGNGIGYRLGVNGSSPGQLATRHAIVESTVSKTNNPAKELDLNQAILFSARYKEEVGNPNYIIKMKSCDNSACNLSNPVGDTKRINFSGVTYIGGMDDDGDTTVLSDKEVDVGEIIIFNRYLRQDEIDAIMEYLSQKWKIGNYTS